MEAPHFVTYVQNIVHILLLCSQSVSDARGDSDSVRCGTADTGPAATSMRWSWGLRVCREVNVQSLVAAVTSLRFQAGELAFLFSFLAFLLPGHGSSFLRRAFAFCLNRCL